MGSTTGWAVTRDGRRLHYERHGAGAPVVVFESGMGASRSMWGAVVPAVAERATAVAYDRSGLGRSEPDTEPRDLARLSADLLDLLEPLDGPAVLVGHSWGGVVVRSVAAARPGLVAGLVLVDPTDETCDLFFEPRHEQGNRRMMPLMPLMARLGLVRMGVKRLAAQLPDEAGQNLLAEDGSVASTQILVAEMRSFYDDLRRLRADPIDTPDVPVTIITGMQTSRMERGQRPALLAAHRARAAALPQGRHVEAAHSGHHIPFSEPDLVVEEILRVLDAVNPQEPPT